MKERKRVGIISMYYNSKNCGGLLQAYALTKVICDLGFCSEQICWCPQTFSCSSEKRKKMTFKNRLKSLILIPLNFCGNIVYSHKMKRRKAFCKEFEHIIPHSNQKYTSENIKMANNEYDIFIAGSDQIWNMLWYNPEYFLDFVAEGKNKFSYAASMPDTRISVEEKKKLITHLSSFDSISVREKNTEIFLSELLNRQISTVLDPTLLLDINEWSLIATERIVAQKYIFCYFLNDDKEDKRIAKQFAKILGIKIATFQHLDSFHYRDLFFADYNFYVGPKEFLSLIRNAEYVITDSFHAAVFSNIFNVKHFVFSRGNGEMDSRVTNLLKMFDQNDRFCVGAERHNVKYLLDLKDINVDNNVVLFEKNKRNSIDFLYKNLKEISKNEK